MKSQKNLDKIARKCSVRGKREWLTELEVKYNLLVIQEGGAYSDKEFSYIELSAYSQRQDRIRWGDVE